MGDSVVLSTLHNNPLPRAHPLLQGSAAVFHETKLCQR